MLYPRCWPIPWPAPWPVLYGGIASFGLLTVLVMGQRYLLVVTG